MLGSDAPLGCSGSAVGARQPPAANGGSRRPRPTRPGPAPRLATPPRSLATPPRTLATPPAGLRQLFRPRRRPPPRLRCALSLMLARLPLLRLAVCPSQHFGAAFRVLLCPKVQAELRGKPQGVIGSADRALTPDRGPLTWSAPPAAILEVGSAWEGEGARAGCTRHGEPSGRAHRSGAPAWQVQETWPCSYWTRGGLCERPGLKQRVYGFRRAPPCLPDLALVS